MESPPHNEKPLTTQHLPKLPLTLFNVKPQKGQETTGAVRPRPAPPFSELGTKEGGWWGASLEAAPIGTSTPLPSRDLSKVLVSLEEKHRAQVCRAHW